VAITQIKVKPESLSMNVSTDNQRISDTVSIQYRVKTDSDYLPVSLLSAAQAYTGGPHEIPATYDQYEFRQLNGSWATLDSRPGIYARDFRVSKDEDHRHWIVEVTWRPLDVGDTPGDLTNENPIQRPVRLWLEFAEETIPVQSAWNVEKHIDPSGVEVRAIDTKGPIQTTVGEDFEESLHETVTSVVLAFEKNYATLDEIYALFAAYGDSVNSNDSYLGRFGRYHARFQGITCSPEETESNYQFYRAVGRVKLRADRPFLRDIVNRGWKYNDPNSPPGDEIKTHTGAEPILLTFDGQKLPDNTVGELISYRTLRAVDYTSLVPS